MENLLNPESFEKSLKRLERINADTLPQWGKMNAAQMMHHCQKPLLIALGKSNFGLQRNLLAQWFFKSQLYNDKPWPKGMRTPKAFKVDEEKDCTREKSRLKELLQEFYMQRHRDHWPKHPVFGQFTAEQIGKMQYKHLDHHLNQFGV